MNQAEIHNIKTLAVDYGVSVSTFRRYIKPVLAHINKGKRHYFTPKELNLIKKYLNGEWTPKID